MTPRTDEQIAALAALAAVNGVRPDTDDVAGRGSPLQVHPRWLVHPRPARGPDATVGAQLGGAARRR